MIYSNACAYAIRAMTHLAMVRPHGYLLLDELCEATLVPRHFIAKIFQDLVRKGLLVSAKGRGGGFALARPPAEIRLIDIVEAIDGVLDLHQCVVGLAHCDDEQPCPYHESWMQVKQSIMSFLCDTSLDEMSEALQRKLDLIGITPPEPQSKSKPVRLR